MDGGISSFELIIFAAIAAVLILRLRSVLGRRMGHSERPGNDPFTRSEANNAENGRRPADNVVQLPDRGADPLEGVQAEVADPAAGGLAQIKAADPEFEVDGFMGGARGAFEMILTSYANADLDALRPLLSNEVFDDFAGAIKGRRQADQTLETTLIGVNTTKIVEAEMQGRTAFITIKFVSEQINLVKDSEGRIVDGDPNQVDEVTDLWTFARNTRSRDPNWTLVATQSPG